MLISLFGLFCFFLLEFFSVYLCYFLFFFCILFLFFKTIPSEGTAEIDGVFLCAKAAVFGSLSWGEVIVITSPSENTRETRVFFAEFCKTRTYLKQRKDNRNKQR
jgi:hypothetical protein